MARGRPFRFARFGRGLNTTDGPYSLREGYEDDPSGLGAEARDLLNVVSSHRGNVRRRDGCTPVGVPTLSGATDGFSVGERVLSLDPIGAGGESFAIVATTLGALLVVPASAPRSTVAIATGKSTTAPWVFKRLTVQSSLGPAYGMNGTDTPLETDGTVAGTGTWDATAGSVPNGTVMAYHENRLLVAGVDAFPYRLYSCAPGNPRDWDTSGNAWALDIAPDDGLPTTAVCSSGPYAVVFKERGIWVVYDAETGANRKVVDGVGTISPRSVVATDQGLFFFDPEQGVMVFDGREARPVSRQIDATLGAIAKADKREACGAYVDGHYYLSVPQ